MAEKSYPFSADNPTTGASKAVSELEWQNMANMWGGDRVDYQLGWASQTSANLPFYATVNNVTSVRVRAGRAWTGGFFYENTSNKDLDVAANSSNTGRIDLIVVRANMASPSVNLAVRQGVNAATPVPPQPVRVPGGIWEMPLWEISVPANGGTITLSSRAPYNLPPPVAFPWNSDTSAALMPPGTFSYDVDSNSNGGRYERFNDKSGPIISRTLGGTLPYTPALLNDSNLPSLGITYTGQYRWIAPGTVSFRCTIYNDMTLNHEANAGFPYGIRLPVPASTSIRQVFGNGILQNAAANGGMPTFTTLTGLAGTGSNSSFFTIYLPSPTAPQNGLDNFRVFPGKATVYFTGVYETNTFDDWQVVSG
ncbi:hypothetical protein [Streptomyces globisporus]|uniref:hypothetical protein n=1 Tax=Streptomyces globisporus TaxID=1908 RepID=UPI0036C690EB